MGRSMAAQIGVYGLGVMGKNLALNLADKGFSTAVSDRSSDPVDALLSEARQGIQGHRSPQTFAASLERPRRILVMIKAGAPTDATIASLAPFLDPGDILVDGGNALFSDTERRARELSLRGIRFIGMGVSGGEQGARRGPSLMPGGPREAYDHLAPILVKIAAQVDDGPCVAYMGPGGAGHYVKMVHNGIEYADMQLIAEAYDVLRRGGGVSNRDLAALFDEWNRGELESFLIDITARILRRPDTETGGELVDRILDTAATKGTGGWTVQDAAALGAPIPTIAAALDARLISAAKTERVAAAPLLPGPRPSASPDGRLAADVRHALYASKLCSYAQGMGLLAVASRARDYRLDLAEIARIWKGGCIIRARLLARIQEAMRRNPSLPNLLLDPWFREELASRQDGWRRVVALGAEHGLPLPATAASLAYYTACRCPPRPRRSPT
ncbi:MAG: phosphogluconate dehydrogenase (NADP(+)-dependent, decarboxylating), partial [Nitrospirae bacterium RIFCSPHIGHO2_01_FULL_66_17]